VAIQVKVATAVGVDIADLAVGVVIAVIVDSAANLVYPDLAVLLS
jgi:hypothetical protein